jgi:LHFPL tetraspan subfamily member protein
MKPIQSEGYASFKWTSRFIGVIWAFLTACFAIINIFIFVQPQWIGDTLASPRAGHFGLYSYCVSSITDHDFDCHGTWTNFNTILNASFAVATFFVGLSALLILICLALFILFLFLRAQVVYFICATIQIICALCLLIAVVVYPAGFDNETVRSVCGSNVNDFYIDTCQIRWAFILAMITFFTILILAVLALFLGMKQPNIDHMNDKLKLKDPLTKYGELNEAFDERTFIDSTLPIKTFQHR